MSMVPVHSVSDFRFHTLKISAYFLENKTTAFMVQRAQVKVYAVKQSSPYRGAFHTNKQPPQRSQHHEITVFIYSFTNPLKKKKNWIITGKVFLAQTFFQERLHPAEKVTGLNRALCVACFRTMLCVASDVQICSRVSLLASLKIQACTDAKRAEWEFFLMCTQGAKITNPCMLHRCHCRHWGSIINPASWIWNAMYNFIIEWRWNQPPA